MGEIGEFHDHPLQHQQSRREVEWPTHQSQGLEIPTSAVLSGLSRCVCCLVSVPSSCKHICWKIKSSAEDCQEQVR